MREYAFRRFRQIRRFSSKFFEGDSKWPKGDSNRPKGDLRILINV